MKTILALTVGGSCTPIVTAIKSYTPDFVVFIVSTGSQGSRQQVDGTNKPCRQGEVSTPSIVEQSGLTSDKYAFIELDEPDSLELCFEKILAGLRNQCVGREEWQKIADYTGGTKTMSAALVLCAFELDWQLSLVQGNRTDLQKVHDGTEMTSLVNTAEVRARQQLDQAKRLFDQFAYASAAQLAENLMRKAPLSAGLKKEIQKLVTLSRGFDAWDRFDHQRAYEILDPYRGDIGEQWRFLKTLLGKTFATGYEAVLDLINNAERRAERKRFDDAVARLYRALEMFAQIRLKKREPSLDSSDLNLMFLPESIRSKYEGRTGKIKLGLVEDYELLLELDDPLGKVFELYRNQLLDILKTRNESILAHGSKPCDEAIYSRMRNIILEFVNEGLSALNLEVQSPQFPAIHKIWK